ncbi:MAG TPA: hypothetical protein VE932_06945 [Patescibacteria group bacterium]|nr:hypothetical protein [Patescibacteria group bacterium]
MKTTLVLGALAVALVVAAPAWADHNRLVVPADAERDVNAESGRPESAKPEGSKTDGSLDIDLKLGVKGFRFGSRLFGREGYAGGAWLNGETRPEGFSLDGRFERDGRAHNFKMNVEIDEWLRRAARWWSRGLTDL